MLQSSWLPIRELAAQPDDTMGTGREIRSYDYVNHPYERVRDALRQSTHGVSVGHEGGCFPCAIGRY
jgi:hypothetical protein